MRGFGNLSASRRITCLLTALLPVWVLLYAKALPLAQGVPWLVPWLKRPCALQALTRIPCPFCGATRATMLGAEGAWLASLALNPMGTVLLLIGPVAGMWLLFCGVWGRDVGLSATGRFVKKIGAGALILGVMTGLWGYKILLDCVLGIAG